MGLQEVRRRWPLGSCSNTFRPPRPGAVVESGRLQRGATPIRRRDLWAALWGAPVSQWTLFSLGRVLEGRGGGGLSRPGLEPTGSLGWVAARESAAAQRFALIMPACAAIGRDSAILPALFRATGSTQPAGLPPACRWPFCVPVRRRARLHPDQRAGRLDPSKTGRPSFSGNA